MRPEIGSSEILHTTAHWDAPRTKISKSKVQSLKSKVQNQEPKIESRKLKPKVRTDLRTL